MDNAAKNEDFNLEDIMPVTEYVDKFPGRPWPTLAAARWAINARKRNGLSESGALLKLNNRVFIHKPSMFNWLINSQYK